MWQSAVAKANELVLFPSWEVEREARDVILNLSWEIADSCSMSRGSLESIEDSLNLILCFRIGQLSKPLFVSADFRWISEYGN